MILCCFGFRCLRYLVSVWVCWLVSVKFVGLGVWLVRILV